MEYMNRNKDPLYDKITYFEKEQDDYALEIAFQYTTGYSENIFPMPITSIPRKGELILMDLRVP